ncbi:MAG: hypothetical protein K6A67_09740 [Bacteroidales bacterium]|nr:hypothetical protein [Bacteroidales bacterium]
MKRLALLAFALVATITVGAQNIAVVSPSDSTNVYQTLDEAIAHATDNSTIYLPGGGLFVTDSAVINKRLTIIGVSHRYDTDNVDGATLVNGNLSFAENSSGSAVMGIYLTGNINIGTPTDSVLNVTIRYCNINSVQVMNKSCSGIIINQNYIRGTSSFSQSNPKITYNILHSLWAINGGTISNNIITNQGKIFGGYGSYGAWYHEQVIGADNTIIKNNVIINPEGYNVLKGKGCTIYKNMLRSEWGEECVVIATEIPWTDVFKGFKKDVNILSDFTFKNDYMKYNDIGINWGIDFDDKALAPIPRIISKKIDDQTNSDGKLLIEVTVKAQ